MEMTTILAICCFVLGVPQGLSSFLQLMDRFDGKKSKGNMNLPRSPRTFTAFLLLAGTFFTIGLGFWLWNHPLKPSIIEKTITVEKTLPCPPTKTGNATTHGLQSPANSGSNNSTTYGGTSAPSDKSKPQ